jgi:hypothetical protein
MRVGASTAKESVAVSRTNVMTGSEPFADSPVYAVMVKGLRA